MNIQSISKKLTQVSLLHSHIPASLPHHSDLAVSIEFFSKSRFEFENLIFLFRGILLVGLLIRRRDHAPLKFMGHDLKQFKSMEGFLESGPQFTLQTYILLIGQRKDKYGFEDDFEWQNLSPDDAQRLLVLSFSIFMSYCSIVKTAYGVSF